MNGWTKSEFWWIYGSIWFAGFTAGITASVFAYALLKSVLP